VNAAVIDRGGSTERVSAAAVILATGGFDWDEDLRRAWHPAAQRATAASPGNTGDALRIARALGAATDNLGEGWWMPMMAVPGEEVDGTPYPRSLIRERAVPRQIMVNAAGRRFVNEASPYSEVGKAMHRAADGAARTTPPSSSSTRSSPAGTRCPASAQARSPHGCREPSPPARSPP
jgi:3-oxosteroid 1-dehydrogenase